MFVPLLIMCSLSFEIQLLVVLEFFCLLLSLGSTYLAYLCWLFCVDVYVYVLRHSALSNFTGIEV